MCVCVCVCQIQNVAHIYMCMNMYVKIRMVRGGVRSFSENGTQPSESPISWVVYHQSPQSLRVCDSWRVFTCLFVCARDSKSRKFRNILRSVPWWTNFGTQKKCPGIDLDDLEPIIYVCIYIVNMNACMYG